MPDSLRKKSLYFIKNQSIGKSDYSFFQGLEKAVSRHAMASNGWKKCGSVFSDFSKGWKKRPKSFQGLEPASPKR